MSELKPCPFCGGEANVMTYNTGFTIKCNKCLVEGTRFLDYNEAVKSWNTRAPKMIKQCVVRTGFNKYQYAYEHDVNDLAEKLKEGYTVVMCNKIVLEGREYLEYILQKEVEE